MDGDGSVEGEQDGGVQSIRKQRLTTASGKLFLVTLTESVRPLYAIVSSSGARKYTRSTSPLGPSTSTTLRDSLTFCSPVTLSL